MKRNRLAKYERGMEDMLGYIRWALKKDVPVKDILTNIIHDLREFEENVDEDWFSPRTSGYANK